MLRKQLSCFNRILGVCQHCVGPLPPTRQKYDKKTQRKAIRHTNQDFLHLLVCQSQKENYIAHMKYTLIISHFSESVDLFKVGRSFQLCHFKSSLKVEKCRHPWPNKFSKYFFHLILSLNYLWEIRQQEHFLSRNNYTWLWHAELCLLVWCYL